MKDYALHLPVDEDYYLQPKSSKPAHYMDIIDSKFLILDMLEQPTVFLA
jgi:hypothetical protein